MSVLVTQCVLNDPFRREFSITRLWRLRSGTFHWYDILFCLLFTGSWLFLVLLIQLTPLFTGLCIENWWKRQKKEQGSRRGIENVVYGSRTPKHCRAIRTSLSRPSSVWKDIRVFKKSQGPSNYNIRSGSFILFFPSYLKHNKRVFINVQFQGLGIDGESQQHTVVPIGPKQSRTNLSTIVVKMTYNLCTNKGPVYLVCV